MRCDVCNVVVVAGEGTTLTPQEFAVLLDNGQGIDESTVALLTDAGMSRERAVESLKRQYRMSRSDWLLCSRCAGQAATASESADGS